MDKKIVLFSRTSTTQQDVEQQTNALKESAKQLGYPIKNQIIIEYQESGIKLGIDERQGIQRLKEAILINDAINCVICWELTRIGRRGDVIYDIRNFLAERKIRWIVLKPSLVELIDSNGQVTPTMSLMLGIFTSFAESEMGIKRDRFARAKNKLREENKKFAGATIFGYIKDRNKYCIPHPDDSKIIVDLFNYYNSNSDATVYETFKYACSKYPAKFKMLPYHRAHRKMMHIFETEIYGYGNWCYPPLISKELYDKTREKMSKAKCQARYESKCQILGRGKVYCKYCGHMLTGVGGTVKAYNCSNKDENHNVTISVDIVDKLIWDEARVLANINASISNTTRISEISKEIEEKTTLSNSFQSQIKEIEEKENKLLDLYLANRIKREIYDARSADLTSEKAKVENNITTINNQITSLNIILESSQKDIVHQRTLNFDEIESFEQRQEIVRKYIDKVYVEKVEPRVYMIEFTYPTGIYIVQRGLYKYIGRNQNKQLYRINADGTEDRLI